MNATRLTLGPVQYYWPRKTMLAFYAQMAQAPLDVIYVGETVCARRSELRLPDWLALATELREGGRQVVLSTQVLLEGQADVKAMGRLIDSGFAIEANDFGAVHRVPRQAGFVAGASLNVFNAATLALLADLGAQRWVVAPEIDAEALQALQRARPAGLQTEVFAYGRVPLAYSARCFTARHFNLQKDLCGFRCMDHPDGLPLSTQDGERFLNINGVQTQSARVLNLLGELPQLAALEVELLRISPQYSNTADVVQCFRDVLDARRSTADAQAELARWMPDAPCNGFWHGEPGAAQHATMVN